MDEPTPNYFCEDSVGSQHYTLFKKVNEIQNDLHSAVAELRGVKDAVEMLTKAVGTLTEFVEQSAQVEGEVHDKMDEYFPIKSDEELSDIDEKIKRQSGDRYIKHMVRLLSQEKMSRSIRNIISEEVILNYNLDGAQHKKRLRSFENFFRALLHAIGQVEPSESAEKALSKAMRCVKTLHAGKRKIEGSPLNVKVKAKTSRKFEIFEYFPIKSDDELSEIDERINKGNCDKYIEHMVLLLSRQKMSRSIRNIFSEELILKYNIDGSQSKKKLNVFENFLPALLTVSQVEPSVPAKKALTKAMRCVKNLHSSRKKRKFEVV
ncbi:uncharacterized protein LOC108027417 isoform X2 [Drosophila biarmipes]|uniref:uncharacterized protein LOC108027417 isoform X2 n=1 Tax=Drosophila biarmipes TaxID=125945 RepID=UPI001CDAAD7F|nr:uncharacterized protein LOC108027417 isoform X2 [Drosophila biarmipes]